VLLKQLILLDVNDVHPDVAFGDPEHDPLEPSLVFFADHSNL
jgi:hypothetical protein